MSYQKLDQYASYLRSFPRFSSQDFLKLARIKLLLKKLGHPEKTFQGVQVAGTNGKGSCVSFLENILKQAGFRVGSFYSPHLVSLTERIRVNGKKITKKRLTEIIDRLRPLVNQIEKETKDRVTWFELITTAAVIYFFEENVNLVIFEVGLGGRKDATTALGLSTKVITNVGYDHTKVLGNTISGLAHEKAGIIQKGNTVITGARGKALKIIQNTCQRQRCSLLVVGKDIKYLVKKIDFTGTYLDLETPKEDFKNLKLSLIGQHQARNFACALGAIEVLREKGFPISKKDIEKAAVKVKYEGRFQILEKNPLVILDGAHNLSGIKALITALEDLKIDPKNLVVIFGAKRRKKRITAILKELSAYSQKIIFPNLSALSGFHRIEILRRYCPSAKISNSLEKAVKQAKETAGKKGTVVVCGSLHLLGEVLRQKNKKSKVKIDLLDDNLVEKVKLKKRIKSK